MPLSGHERMSARILVDNCEEFPWLGPMEVYTNPSLSGGLVIIINNYLGRRQKITGLLTLLPLLLTLPIPIIPQQGIT